MEKQIEILKEQVETSILLLNSEHNAHEDIESELDILSDYATDIINGDTTVLTECDMTIDEMVEELQAAIDTFEIYSSL